MRIHALEMLIINMDFFKKLTCKVSFFNLSKSLTNSVQLLCLSVTTFEFLSTLGSCSGNTKSWSEAEIEHLVGR